MQLIHIHSYRGTIENFVGIHPTSQEAGDHKEQMLQQFGHFDSKVVEVLK